MGFIKSRLNHWNLQGSAWKASNWKLTAPTSCPPSRFFSTQTNGQRASYYLPGRNETLTPAEITQARPLLEKLAANDGILLMTLEMPLETAAFVLAMASELDLPVMLDPGGQPPEAQIDFAPLFVHSPKWIKPNAEEAERITGVGVQGYKDAKLCG